LKTFKSWFVRFIIVLSISILGISIQSCSKKSDEISSDKIIVKIDDRTITVDEFIRRAEYTIRPAYCKMDNYIHKKIVLNSLIAEKLLALESDEDSPLMKNENFQAHIRGRKEQAMRQVLYYQEAYEKVKLDTGEVRTTFNLAGRTYDVSHFSLSDGKKAQAIADSLNSGDWTFNEVHQGIWGNEEITKRQVGWEERNHEAIEKALFTEPLKMDQVVGPIQVGDDEFIFIKIDGWTDSRVITEQMVQQRHLDVRERLTHNHAGQIWTDIVLDIMKDKRLEFVEDTYWKINEIFFNQYYVTEKEKKDAFNRKFWQGEDVELTLDDLEGDEDILNYPFFSIDGKVWTVKEFKKLLLSHPLVFRESKIPASDFPKQFKLAVVDLIRDKYITDEAYKMKLDQNSVVKSNTSMWEDSFLASYQKAEHLYRATNGKKVSVTQEVQVEQYMNPYIDSLQEKYSDRIDINMDAFEKIKLTHIDMYVTQRDMPYQVVVPSFPTVTTDNRLDYGKLMEK